VAGEFGLDWRLMSTLMVLGILVSLCIYVSGLQPFSVFSITTWAFGPGWYVARLWRFDY
jgi:hypothetical protein